MKGGDFEKKQLFSTSTSTQYGGRKEFFFTYLNTLLDYCELCMLYL